MIYSKKIYLDCEEDIRKFAISDIERKIDLSKPISFQIKLMHFLPESLKFKINTELRRYNIPEILYAQSYLRPKNNFQGIHIDGEEDSIISSAINIPLKGTDNSYQIWYTGKYTTSIIRTHNNVYHLIKWIDKPIEAERLEINSAHLIRVDQPHSAQSSTNEDRWIFTMRFRGNPNFEDLLAQHEITNT
jgi:hypothetical protein